MPKVSDEHKQRRRERDPRRRTAGIRTSRLRGCDRRPDRGGDRPLPGRDLQLLREQGGALRHACAPLVGSVRGDLAGGGLPGAARGGHPRGRRLALRPGRGEPPGPDGRELPRADREAGQETEATRPERYARLGRTVRDDVPIEVAAQFLGMLANGVAFARVTGDPMPNLDDLMTLIETGIAPRSSRLGGRAPRRRCARTSA